MLEKKNSSRFKKIGLDAITEKDEMDSPMEFSERTIGHNFYGETPYGDFKKSKIEHDNTLEETINNEERPGIENTNISSDLNRELQRRSV